MAIDMSILHDKSWFKPDSETTDGGKNDMLGTLMMGPWHDLSVVRIERIEMGAEKGWKVTYRE